MGGSWNALWAAGDGYVNPPFPGAACACMSCVVECPRAADEPSKECKGEHESSLGENNFNDRGNGDLNWQTTYVYTLYNGYSCALSGWTHTRDYAKGFLTNAAGTNPNAKISGLNPNQEYKYSIYQFASSFAGTNGFTAPGANEIETTTNTNDEPTASGTFISDSNGEALFQFRRMAHHVHLSGISIAATCAEATLVHHHNGGWCSGNGEVALTPKENYEKVDVPHISEAECRSRCEADAQCDFAETMNNLAYASGWPRVCQLHRNAYCDPEKLITTDIWYQVWLKGSAIPPPTMIPTASPSQNPTINPTKAYCFSKLQSHKGAK